MGTAIQFLVAEGVPERPPTYRTQLAKGLQRALQEEKNSFVRQLTTTEMTVMISFCCSDSPCTGALLCQGLLACRGDVATAGKRTSCSPCRYALHCHLPHPAAHESISQPPMRQPVASKHICRQPRSVAC